MYRKGDWNFGSAWLSGSAKARTDDQHSERAEREDPLRRGSTARAHRDDYCLRSHISTSMPYKRLVRTSITRCEPA